LPEGCLEYVDGEPRDEGVRAFSRSRGIDLPFGDPSDLDLAETLFSTTNGYLGMRASFEESAPAWQNGMFIN
jgi:hypothetical protein